MLWLKIMTTCSRERVVEAEEAAVVDQVADLEVVVEVVAEPALALAQALALAPADSAETRAPVPMSAAHLEEALALHARTGEAAPTREVLAFHIEPLLVSVPLQLLLGL